MSGHVDRRRPARSRAGDRALFEDLGDLVPLLIHAVLSAGSNGQLWRPGEMLVSILVGAAVGALGAAVLWLLLQETQRTLPRQAVPAVLMMVAAALVGADLIREDAASSPPRWWAPRWPTSARSPPRSCSSSMGDRLIALAGAG
jgi:hypothetical protein